MTKPIETDVVRQALETAAALERAAQSAWQERSRAVYLFETSRQPQVDPDSLTEARESQR